MPRERYETKLARAASRAQEEIRKAFQVDNEFLQSPTSAMSGKYLDPKLGGAAVRAIEELRMAVSNDKSSRSRTPRTSQNKRLAEAALRAIEELKKVAGHEETGAARRATEVVRKPEKDTKMADALEAEEEEIDFATEESK